MPRGFLQTKAPVVIRSPDATAVAQGTPASPSAAWFVVVTDGTSTLGTAANPLVVAPVAVAADPNVAIARRLDEQEGLRLRDLELLGLRTRPGERVTGLYFSRGR